MNKYIVTIKLPKDSGRDPHNKMAGRCPANQDRVCTDITGEHHSLLFTAPSLEAAYDMARKQFKHVTRVEGAGA